MYYERKEVLYKCQNKPMIEETRELLHAMCLEYTCQGTFNARGQRSGAS